MADKKKILYERLGGHDAIAAVANDLLLRLQSDPQLGRFWAHRGEDGVKREKPLLIDFLCASTAALKQHVIRSISALSLTILSLERVESGFHRGITGRTMCDRYWPEW